MICLAGGRVWTGSRVEDIEVRIRSGRVAGFDDVSGERVDLRGALLTPGLINAHDHLAANHYGPLLPRSRYVDAADWASEAHERVRTDPKQEQATKEASEVVLPFDFIVVSGPRAPRNALTTDLMFRCDELYTVGDAVVPRNVCDAVHEGFKIGVRI